MVMSGRLVWIKSVLPAVPIYTLMAKNLPPWALKEIDRICRKFLWVGRDESVRGKCLVVWPTVCRSTNLGGLGINDLKLAGFALQTCWLWLQKVDQDRRRFSYQSKPPRGSSFLQSVHIHGTRRQATSFVLGGQMVGGRIHRRPCSIPQSTGAKEN
jgi:hypothetical protein